MHRAGLCHLRPGLDAAAAHARVPGVSLRARRGQQRRRIGAGRLLWRRHLVHRDLGWAAGRPAGLTSFAAAVAQVEDARVYAGFHFRFSCADAATLGAQVARYVTGALMQPLR